MTEQEWLATTNPYDLSHHKASRSERKRRLLACAFARRVFLLIPDLRYREIVETAEEFADGNATMEQLKAAQKTVNKLWKNREFTEAGNHAATAVLATVATKAVQAVHACESAAAAWASVSRSHWQRAHAEESRAQCVLARDVFGNPFRPVIMDPSWLSTDVVDLAQTAYEERCLPEATLESMRLAILADALQDAGCDHDDILAHCRGAQPHIRGCWVVDLILGRS